MRRQATGDARLGGRLIAAITTLAGLAVALIQTGCGCGVVAVSGSVDDTDAGIVAYVDAGVVVFEPTLVGTVVQFDLPVTDSADTNETLLGASFSGTGAADFTVLSSFPIPIPAGAHATVEVEFTPSVSGAVTAVLNLQTEDMGVSPIRLAGEGVTADAG
jgi:hypothetical protein